MRHCGILTSSVVLVTSLVFFFEYDAHAYLDLGTGSYVIQIIIGVMVGAFFGTKIYLGKIKAVFRKLFRKRREDESEND